MKVILTGSTGSVGSAVLEHCIANPHVTSIVALTRRPLDTKNAKVNNIVTTNFKTYDEKTLEQLKDARACIWALGSPTSGKEVHIDYTWAAVNTFLDALAPQLPAGEKFRFVYTSGGAVPYLASRAAFFLGSWRMLRNDLDNDLLALESKHPDSWESFVVRPWFVVDEKPRIGSVLANSYIYRPELGAAMTDMALNGKTASHMVDNAELRKIGQASLARLKL